MNKSQLLTIVKEYYSMIKILEEKKRKLSEAQEQRNATIKQYNAKIKELQKRDDYYNGSNTPPSN